MVKVCAHDYWFLSLPLKYINKKYIITAFAAIESVKVTMNNISYYVQLELYSIESKGYLTN